MIKNCMRCQICRVLAVKKQKIRFRTLKPSLLIPLSHFLLILAISASAWGQFFESPPRVIDDANEDTVFSPNGDGVQDNLIISFVTNGFQGDYRITIDVHGPGAVGRPDGKFDIEDDWFVKGKVGSGQLDLQPPDDPKIIHQEWDGLSRAPSQDSPPNARPVGSGSYEILVETDAFEDGVVDITDFTYQSSKLTAVIDVDAPQISSTASHLFFSPNSDAIKDTTTIAYTLSEHLSELSLEFANLESQPAIKLAHITRGRQSFVWNGLDGLRTPLVDGTYNLRLRGTDNGGNVTTFDAGTVQIDTRAPTFSQIMPSQNAYLKTSVTTIMVEFNPAEQESPIDFDSSVTTISLQKNARGEIFSGITRNDVANNRLTLTLDNPLDTISENGMYTAVIRGTDAAGNQVETGSSFYFDTVPPTLEQIRTDNADFRPNGAVNTEITFVEVDLDDNIDSGLNLSASTIALNGPGGAIFGKQTFGGDSTLRWNLKAPIVTDGSEDGIYTITISAADRAGNTVDFGEISFVYDTQAPRLVSLTPNLEDNSFHLRAGTIFRSQPLLRIVAGFDDGDGSGVDFASTRLEIFRADETGVGNILLVGTRHPNPADGTLAFLLSQPLENQDGTQDGAYTVRVTSEDVAGNTDTSQVDLIYDTETPTIVSVTPERDATVTTLSRVTLVMDDRMSGVDFSNTILKLVRDNVEIRATSSNNGKDTAVLTLSNSLATDGSDDGEYRIEITTVDRAGNASDQIERRIFFVSQPPEIRLNVPAKEEVNELTTIDAQLFDYIGTGVNFSPEKSSVVVMRADGTVLPSASVEADKVNNRLIWMAKTPLPRDGSADGEYAVSVVYEDFVGQNFTQDFALIFDTQLPGVAQTTPAAGARVARLGTIAVEFAADLSGIDFSAAQVRLLDPNGVPVGTNQSDNGADIITLRVQELQASVVDGVYIIEVTPADWAGNVADSPFLSGFTYAPREPSILLQPSTNLPTNQLNQITATLQDYVGPGINFDSAETSISVRSTNGLEITAHPIQSNGAELQLIWTAASPLPRDGSADGEYEVVSRFVENSGLGSTSPATFERISTLIFDTQLPQIASTIPSRNAWITQLERATIELEDSLSGVDFDRTLTQLLGPANNSIPTSISNDGEKQITLSFDPFKTDGSVDGVYRLEITPVDLAGNVGGLSTVEFVYATQAPEIEMLTPSNESMINRVPEIRVLIRDNSGEGIDFEKSMITLSDASGADIHGILGDDGERTLTLRLGLPTDGTVDGKYSVNLNLVDNLGAEVAYTRQFTYDSVPPTIVAESRPPRENRIIENRIIVEFEVTDTSPVSGTGSGVDFDATTIQLHDSNGEPIAGEAKDDGIKTVTFTSAELTSVGVYTLTVVVADRAGNVSVPQRFTYGDLIKPPRVASILPPPKSRVNRLTEISTVLEDQSGTGIDFSATGSSMELRNPSNPNDMVVGGTVVNDGVDTMTLKLIDPLLTDGSDDGVYTVTVQPVDQLGVSGQVRQFRIIYDTQNPRVQSVSHIDMTANVSNVKDSVRRIEVELIETGSGIDFERSYVQLWRHTGDERVLVVGALDDDGLLLWWQLDNPLARNGVDDGLYSVEIKAVDNAGNVEEKEYRLLYDTQVPVIGSVKASVVAGGTLELDASSIPNNNRIVVECEVIDTSPVSGTGSGVDFDATTIQLHDSNGEPIAGEAKDDGIKTVTFTSAELTSVGVYTLTVVVADRAGNVSVPQRFTYGDLIKPPRVASILPPPKSRVNRLTEISTVLEDQSGTGIDFSATGSSMELRNPSNPNDMVVGGTVVNDGVDTMTLKLIDPLLTDGSDDGVYTVTVQPVDQLGVSGQVRQFRIIYDTQNPRVQSVSHIDMTANVSNVKDSVRRIEVELIETGSGIDFERSYVQLWRHTGDERVLVVGALDDDGLLLWWQLDNPLARNGVDDGLYSVEIKAVDNAGNVEEKEYRLLYDTQVPVIGSVKASVVAGGTLELDASSIPNNNRIVVECEVIDTSPVSGTGSGVDFDATTIQLHDSNGEPIAGEAKDDGIKTVTFTSAELTSVGVYTLTVVVADRAGNVSVPQRFTYGDLIKPPRVASILPPPKSRVNRLTEISTVLEDQSGTGIDFSATGSSMELRNPSNPNDMVVGGTVVNDGVDTMTLKLIDPLLTDGSDDGVYTVTVQPVDQLGVSGQVRQFRIIYDTQNPRVQSVSHIDMTANVSNVKDSVRRIEVELIETGSGIDFERSYVQLWRHTGDERVLVVGALDDDGLLLWWQLDNPLARNGVDDGLYSVEIKAVDNAGNVEEKEYRLLYDTQVPVIGSVKASVVAGGTLELDTGGIPTVVEVPIHQIHLVFPDGSGSGIDVSQTTVQLIQSNGIAVAATQQNDGIETVSLRFKPLRDDGTDDGRYFIRVAPIDFSGNTYTSPLEFQFLYSTRKPEIVLTTPAEYTSVNLLDSVSAVLLDHSGEGIDFDRSTVGLYNDEGNLIDGRQHVDTESSVITWDLDQPLSRDGVDDGEYSIRLVAFDGAGSELKSSKTFLYDTQIPQIVSVSVGTILPMSIPINGLEVLNQSFAQVAVRLSDERVLPDGGQISASGIDFVGTMVRLIAPNNEQKGVTVSDDGEAQLIVSFTPLVQPGTYTLEITPRDLAGNASGHPIQYKFSLNLAKPRVDSVAIGEHMAPVAFVNQLDKITAKLVDPNGVGLDLTTGGSTLSVMGPNGVVDGLQEGSGVDELVWIPLHLPVDGTADGRYTVTITPVDSLGLSGAPARYEFVLDTQIPELIGVDPLNLTHAVSYIGGQIIQISAQVVDVGPAGLDISEQTIQLQDANGSPVPADLTSDGDRQVFLTLAQPLATNGSNDGEYSTIISLGDRAGNTLEVEHTFVYDTQAPTLVNTDPAGDLVRDDLTSIVVDLSDRGGSGIDFAVSHLMLFDPNGNQVNGQLGNDGVGQLTLQLDELAEDGSYRIRVLAVDRAGNGANAPFDRTFLFSTNLPTVVSTVPITAPAENAFTRTPPNQVEVEFQSSPNLSTVRLIHPNGTTVPGQQIRDGNRLIYHLSRELASDGSDDGSYTILVTPVNSAGRSGEQQQYNFIYDTVLPEVDGILPVVESPSVNNALNEIVALVTDANPGSSIDWDELDDSWVTFEKLGLGQKIRGRLSTDRDQIISFRLESPLASDGSQDGKYRVIVMPRDRAGNVAIPTALEFFLDTRPPTIHTDSLLINDRPLFVSTNHPDYPSADGSGSGVVIQTRMSDLGSDGMAGLGVDLSRSSIVVTAPDGTSLTGNLIQNGTDTIVFKSGPLIAQGFYRVEITSVGLDVDGLGFAPTDSITTQFLHETTEPVAELTDFGGKTSLTDEPLPLRGTATDPVSLVEEGTDEEQGGTDSASGIAFVEIIGMGPDGEPIQPVLAVDKSGVESEPWSSWSLDFLPARSGGYNLDIRVTDRAGNVAVYDGVTVNLSVSLTYRGSTYSWPSPLRHSTGDRAHFSFDVNIPSGSKINMTLSIYDFAGDLVFEDTFSNISPGRDSDQLVTWDLKNQAGAAIARGVYIFRLEAEDIATQNLSNAVGKLLVIE